MDYLAAFLPYVDVDRARLNRYVEQSGGLMIAKKYAALSKELADARAATMGACHITADGQLEIDMTVPGIQAIQDKIAALEPRVTRLAEIAAEIGAQLEAVGVTDPTNSLDGIERKLENANNRTNIAPACWQRFALERGNSGKLPGEVMVGPYAVFEEQKIAQKEAAEAELVTLRAANHAIHALFDEARAL